MLLGSFQEMPRKNGKSCSIADVERRYYDCLGFKPIWCFPINDSFLESYFQSISVAPNVSEVLMIFETNEYVRIDRIKHYRNLKNDIYDIRDCIDDSIDDLHSEIIIDAEKAEKYLREIILISNLQLFKIGKASIKDASPLFKNLSDNMEERIRLLLSTLPDTTINENILQELPVKMNELAAYLTINGRFAFNTFLFPIVYNQLMNGESKLYWLFSFKNPRNIVTINNDITEWSYNNNSKESYDMIFKKFSDMVTTNEKLLIDISTNSLPYPNDKCPYCNSNKKFKKCCGKDIRKWGGW